MSVLRPLAGTEGVSLTTKIPNQLHKRLLDVKKRCRERGYTLEVNTEVIKALEKAVAMAEQELSCVEGKAKAATGSA